MLTCYREIVKMSALILEGGDLNNVFLMEINFGINPPFAPIGATGHLVNQIS